jgi:hypothetical protein
MSFKWVMLGFAQLTCFKFYFVLLTNIINSNITIMAKPISAAERLGLDPEHVRELDRELESLLTRSWIDELDPVDRVQYSDILFD